MVSRVASLALAFLCLRAFSIEQQEAEEDGSYVVTVDAAGETHGAFAVSEPKSMSLNAILPHWPEAADARSLSCWSTDASFN